MPSFLPGFIPWFNIAQIRRSWIARESSPRPTLSGEDVGNNVSVNVGQSPINAIVAEGQLFVIDAQEMEDGGVQVVAVGRRTGSFVGPFIACAVGDAAFETAA